MYHLSSGAFPWNLTGLVSWKVRNGNEDIINSLDGSNNLNGVMESYDSL